MPHLRARGPRSVLAIVALSAVLAACATPRPAPSSAAPAAAAPAPKLRAGLDARGADPFPSTYRRRSAPAVAILNANILTGTGAEIRGGGLLMAEGRVVAVGAVTPPPGATVIDAQGGWLTPGVIDAHSHLGVFPSPGVAGHADGNENIDPVTAQVWAEHSVWPQDPAFDRARAGGVTSLMVLPGSANLFGGRSVVLKNVPAATVQAMKFPGAPYGLKMACGENPKGRYGSRGRAPATRMGNVAGMRRMWIDAADHARKWDAYDRKSARGDGGDPPKRDLNLDTLRGALDEEISAQIHCYRADEMAVMVDVAHEFGFRVRAFHHAVEAYKIRELLAANDICVATWAGRWGFKMEANDGIDATAGLLTRSGVCVAIHSDDASLIQRLNVESAVALSAARQAGLEIPDAEAVKWFTANPARIMGVLDQTGTLEPGKMADVVLWSDNPFSVYAVARKVFIDGALLHDEDDPASPHRSDFELGQGGDR